MSASNRAWDYSFMPDRSLPAKVFKELADEFGPRVVLDLIEEIAKDTNNWHIADAYGISVFRVGLLRQHSDWCLKYIFQHYLSKVQKQATILPFRQSA